MKKSPIKLTIFFSFFLILLISFSLFDLFEDVTTETDAKDAQKASNKASAKAKLIAGEALTEAEADTIVL